MKRTQWFQRVMITALIAVNSFVFMSMRDFSITENLTFTIGIISILVITLSLINYSQKMKKRKTGQTNKLSS